LAASNARPGLAAAAGAVVGAVVATAGAWVAGATVVAVEQAASNVLKATSKVTTIYKLFFIRISPPKIFI
jgi:hypothetical protein